MLSDAVHYDNIVEMSKKRPENWYQWLALAYNMRDEVGKVSMCKEWGVVNGKKRHGWVQEELIDPKAELISIWADACNLRSVANDDGASFDEMSIFRKLYSKVDRLALVFGVPS